jgi:hypothetical protein
MDERREHAGLDEDAPGPEQDRPRGEHTEYVRRREPCENEVCEECQKAREDKPGRGEPGAPYDRARKPRRSVDVASTDLRRAPCATAAKPVGAARVDAFWVPADPDP